jgi:hypothetical protein
MRTRVTGLLLVVLALLLVACGGAQRGESGEITEGGDVDVFSLNVGDCFGATEGDEVASVQAVPCSEPHESEVFALVDYEDGDEWPGDEAITTFSDEECGAAFEEYIGMSYNESRYFITYLQPTEETWADGDREVVCLVVGPDGEPVTGSLRGVAE